MSTAPQTLVDLRHFLADELQVEKKNFGITGRVTARRPWGFHLGRNDIYNSEFGMGDKDYSVKHPRNKAGLTNASAGFDIRLKVGLLKKLTAFLVEKAKAGETDMLFEVIGPDASGKAKRYAFPGWKPTTARADHEWHIHLSFFRDTENKDKRPLFQEWIDSMAEAPEEPVEEPETPDNNGEIPPEEQVPALALTNVVELGRGTAAADTPVYDPDTEEELFRIPSAVTVKLFGETADKRYRGILARTRDIAGTNPKIALVPYASVSNVHVLTQE